MKDIDTKAIKAVIKMHNAFDKGINDIENIESYMPSRTAGKKYAVRFGYGFDTSRHPVMGKKIFFSTFKKFIEAQTYIEEYLEEKARAATNDNLLLDDIF